MKIDWLIVGAGFTGSVLAERIATQLDQRVLLVERRDHIGGNAYDYYDEHGVLAHKYGPHIFHTNATHVWDYLSRFTDWRIYYHKVLGVIDGQQVPIPFNLNTLEALFPRPYADHLADLLIDAFGYGKKIPILELRNASDGDLSQLADFIYDKVFKNYTQKQWELTPEELGPSVTARVPVFISRDNRYFQDRYQGMPKLGYTELFRRMLRHPNIRILLNTDYRHVKEEIEYRKMVFTGPIDQYFDYCHGELPYRSLRFEMQHDKHKRVQPVGTVNYPNEFAFTRITEFKHLTGQIVPGTTTTIEYPQPHVVGENDPYYPIPKGELRARYKEYQSLAETDADRVLFAGRLADYRYYNMDEYRQHKRPFSQFLRVSAGRQAAVNPPSMRCRPESQPPEPGNGPQVKAIFGGILTIRPSAALPRPSRSQPLVGVRGERWFSQTSRPAVAPDRGATGRVLRKRFWCRGG